MTKRTIDLYVFLGIYNREHSVLYFRKIIFYAKLSVARVV